MMPDVYSALVLDVLEMGCWAMESPVAYLITKPTLLPGWAVFIGMLCVVDPALAAIVPH
jgi:hypothetical protein